jgi:hypothetical protein
MEEDADVPEKISAGNSSVTFRRGGAFATSSTSQATGLGFKTATLLQSRPIRALFATLRGSNCPQMSLQVPKASPKPLSSPNSVI